MNCSDSQAISFKACTTSRWVARLKIAGSPQLSRMHTLRRERAERAVRSVLGMKARMLTIYVDADACSVKDEVYKVARRYGIHVAIVANATLRVPADALIELVVRPGFGAADDWIAERAGRRCRHRRHPIGCPLLGKRKPLFSIRK